MSNGTLDEWDIEHRGLRSISSPEIKTFWNGYVVRRKNAPIEHGSLYSRWRRVADDLVISLYLTNRSVGLFVRGAARRTLGYNGESPVSLRTSSSAKRSVPACAVTKAAAISAISRCP